jgi:hypothetical protein
VRRVERHAVLLGNGPGQLTTGVVRPFHVEPVELMTDVSDLQEPGGTRLTCDRPRSPDMPEPHLRAFDADRAAVADLLRASMSTGRLTVAEYDDRLARTYAARTYGELADRRARAGSGPEAGRRPSSRAAARLTARDGPRETEERRDPGVTGALWCLRKEDRGWARGELNPHVLSDTRT